MALKQLDVRGEICPYPMMKTVQALKKLSANDQGLEVITDHAPALETIPTRIALAAWNDATVAKAGIALGIRAWAEVRGTMVNCNGRVQLMNACPVVASPDLEPAWQVIVRLASYAGKPIPWASELDGWKAAAARVPAFAGLTYRSIGPMGAPILKAEAGAA